MAEFSKNSEPFQNQEPLKESELSIQSPSQGNNDKPTIEKTPKDNSKTVNNSKDRKISQLLTNNSIITQDIKQSITPIVQSTTNGTPRKESALNIDEKPQSIITPKDEFQSKGEDSSSKKRNIERVRFKDATLWMSEDEFKNSKAKDWKDVNNLRVTQDLNLSHPDDSKNEFSKGMKQVIEAEEEDSMIEQRRAIKNEMQEKLTYKRVLGGLEQWQSELRQRKRNEGMLDTILVKEGEQRIQEINQLIGAHVFGTPELNTHIINSILEDEDDEKGKYNKKNNKNWSQSKEEQRGDQEEDQDEGDYNEKDKEDEDEQENSQKDQQGRQGQKRSSTCSIKDQVSQLKNNSSNFKNSREENTFPKSVVLIPAAPVTLTTLHLKKRKPMGSKTSLVSRYFIDEKTNLVITKTDSQLQAEQNNLIINQIFKKKLQKQIDTLKPTTKREYFDIVQTQSALFKSDTLNRFKSLQYLANTHEKPPTSTTSNLQDPHNSNYSAIAYEQLYNELFENKLLQKNCRLEEEQKSLSLKTTYLDEQEKAMLAKYKQIQDNCDAFKHTLSLLRQGISEISGKTKQKEMELKAACTECDRYIYQLELESMQNAVKAQENRKKNAFFVSQVKEVNPYSDQIAHARESKEDALNHFRQIIYQLNEESEKLNKEVDYTQREYQTAKEQKATLKHLLKSHYLTELKQNQRKSLVNIILKLLLIKEDITYNIFPEYLDEQCINFLMSWAKLEQEASERRQKLKAYHRHSDGGYQNFDELANKIIMSKERKEGNIKNSNNNIISGMLNSGNNILNKQVKSPNGSQLTTPRSTVSQLSSTQQQEGWFQSKRNPKQPSQNNKQQYIHQSSEDIEKQLSEISQLEEDLKKKEAEIQQLKQTQVDYLYIRSQKEAINSKEILCSLFGQEEGVRCLVEFDRRQQKQEQIFTANKTFVFSAAINAQQAARKKALSPQPVENKRLNMQFLQENTLQPIKQQQILLGIRKPSVQDNQKLKQLENYQHYQQGGFEINGNMTSRMHDNRDAFSIFSQSISSQKERLLNIRNNSSTSRVNLANNNSTGISENMPQQKRVVSFSQHVQSSNSNPSGNSARFTYNNSSSLSKQIEELNGQQLFHGNRSALRNANKEDDTTVPSQFSSRLSSPRLSVRSNDNMKGINGAYAKRQFSNSNIGQDIVLGTQRGQYIRRKNQENNIEQI